MRRRVTPLTLVIVSAGAILLAGVLSDIGVAASSPRRAAAASSGGDLTVLESGTFGAWPEGLDPASDSTGPANQSLMDAIYGGLFQVGSSGETIPDLATSYELEDGGTTVVLHLRPRVEFSDGTPFDASAVVWNLKRDLTSDCSCKPSWQASSITAPNATTVVIHLKVADGAFIDQLQDTPANWIASPDAEQKMGKVAFALHPVGAGPFEVVSDILSNKLVLKRNPRYWQAGRPYLQQLTFESTTNDEAALEEMESGAAQAYEYMTEPSLVKSFASRFTVTAQPSTSPYAIQLNTTVAPFDNIKAREALYYATNPKPIVRALYGSQYPVVESFTAPGGLFYNPTVPGYRTYNLAKAKALVSSLGGLSVTLFSIDTPIGQEIIEALQSMWEQAGITTTIHVYTLASLVQEFESKKWVAALSQVGSWDPASGVGIAFYFSSASAFSGVDDSHLDSLFAESETAVSTAARAHIYGEIGSYLSQEAYAPFLFAGVTWNVAAHGVSGPGLTTKLPEMISSPQILWQDVSMTKSS